MRIWDGTRKLPFLTWWSLLRLKGSKAGCVVIGENSDAPAQPIPVSGQAPDAPGLSRGPSLDAQEQKLLLDLAERSLREWIATGTIPEIAPGGLPPKLLEPKGCFVTLTKEGRLRGCIGQILPQTPLYKAAMENARRAATRDPRFPPVQAKELDENALEISLLTEPQPLTFGSTNELLNQLRPHVDGVVLQIGERKTTYLPQVWKRFPDKASFMDSLSEKAGLEADAWRSPDAAVSVYQIESIKG